MREREKESEGEVGGIEGARERESLVGRVCMTERWVRVGERGEEGRGRGGEMRTG